LSTYNIIKNSNNIYIYNLYFILICVLRVLIMLVFVKLFKELYIKNSDLTILLQVTSSSFFKEQKKIISPCYAFSIMRSCRILITDKHYMNVFYTFYLFRMNRKSYIFKTCYFYSHKIASFNLDYFLSSLFLF